MGTDTSNVTHTRKGKFAPGNNAAAANRTKRQRGMARLIATETRSGLEMVEAALDIMRNKEHRDRLKAIDWLTIRLCGKVPDVVEVTGKDGQPLNPLAKVDVADLLALAKAQAPEGER